MSIIAEAMDENVEKRARLPIAMLVASGYALGVVLPVWRPSARWLEGAGAWEVFLPFLFLFYSGQERLLDLMREISGGGSIELTHTDKWYAWLVKFVQGSVAAAICVGLGIVAAFLTKSTGLNWYISGAVGFFIAVGILGIVFDN